MVTWWNFPPNKLIEVNMNPASSCEVEESDFCLQNFQGNLYFKMPVQRIEEQRDVEIKN